MLLHKTCFSLNAAYVKCLSEGGKVVSKVQLPSLPSPLLPHSSNPGVLPSPLLQERCPASNR